MSQQFVFGIHAVMALINKQPERIMHLHVIKERHDKKIEQLLVEAKYRHIKIVSTTRQELDGMTEDGNHQGIVAICKRGKVLSESDLPDLFSGLTVPPFVLILDNVQDPHNLGACFRTADAAGVHAIIAPKDKSVGITPVVTKVASGAAEVVPFVQVTNLARAIEILKEMGIWVYGAAAEAEQTIYSTDLRGSVALVLGAEGSGLRRLTREHCDALVRIPMLGSVSSLNVSVAAGVMMFEVLRQRAGS